MKEFIEELLKYSAREKELQPEQAMRILTDLYVEYAGVSRGYRSVIYYAGFYWAETAGENRPFCDLMPSLSEEYDRNKEEYDEYDVSYISSRETCLIAYKLLDELSEASKIALCSGINDDIDAIINNC